MNEATEMKLYGLARELDALAERLAANVPPGHVDYISKAEAARWAERLAAEARKK
jgi:hypothetical protein